MERISSKIDTTILDNIIVGRVEPFIYAFSTETVPNYLKVGDTSRSVCVRLEEWRRIFPNLIQQYEHSAQIDDDTIFRDYAVHTFLEQEKKRVRLQPHTIENLPYYSREFFKDTTAEDVDSAIKDIIQSAREKNGKYPLYSTDRLPKTYIYERVDDFAPRDNQQQAIDNFKTAVKEGRTNLLLYAVMRFGKSFTSMCCAKEINARFVVIVSAKADVKEEWKKTVESHKYFESYCFLDSEALKRSGNVISNMLSEPDKKIALFLTLQDLQGNDIKEKHKEVFAHQIDLLIIDETHFGVRGESYGKVLQSQRLSKSEISHELKDFDGFETFDRIENVTKSLNSKIRLHLSGTPYRILMGDEFQKEDIIAFVQFTDIIDAQQQWNDEHLNEDDCNEWDNPYFGFPQMIRFAFNPNESSRKKMEQMQKDGITYAFAELFHTMSIKNQKDGSHRQFKHEAEILDLFEAIDGTKADENILGFLDYDKIKEGKMCRHIVCVLPFRASCDALKALILKNKHKFKNLDDYEIINIAGFDDEHQYKSTEDVKRAIKDFEAQNKKTLTLTVNRMLTGTTVPQWDTMLYLKDTASPQEYDQAVFRLQNQYITTYKDEHGKIIRYNMKPQTLLVDFDPDRMFVLQELKSQFYDVNKETHGNSLLKEQIAKELEISPIIVLNKGKLQKATPTNITDAVREYSRTRSILDDATEIPMDNNLLQNDTLIAVLRMIEPIDAKNGLKIKPSEGNGDDIDAPDGEKSDVSNEDSGLRDDSHEKANPPKESIEGDNLHKRLAAYYARILFFAFLTESNVKSLKEVIAMISTTEDNCRIARNLGLSIDVLTLVQGKSNPFVLQKFDYKIENINDLMRDESLPPIKRVEIAMCKFGRMSDSEIVTPLNVADDVVNLLPENVFSNGPVLDIASKQGEFTIALLKRYGRKSLDKIYSVCTSTLAYEFTRKVYKLLTIPIEHIFESFTSYDLIQRDKKQNYKIPQKLTDMNFTTVVGNPPYNLSNDNTSDDPIYWQFIDIGSILASFTALITPGRFLFSAGKTPAAWNKRILNDPHFKVERYIPNSTEAFNNVDIKGGLAISIYNKDVDYGKIGIFSVYSELKSIINKVKERSNLFLSGIVFAPESYKLTSELHKDFPKSIHDLGKGHKFDITTNIFSKIPYAFSIGSEQNNSYIDIYGREKNIRMIKHIKSSYVAPHPNLNKWKIILPKSNGTGTFGEILSTPFVGYPKIGHTQTFISLGAFDSEIEANNLLKYIKTKFLRALLGSLKVTQDNKKSTWANVPMQDFTENSDIDWSKSVAEIDAQLYAKYNLSDEEILFIESMIKPM